MLRSSIKYMMFSALAFALLNIGVKYLDAFNVYQIVFFRAAGSLLFTYPFLIKNKISIIGNKVGLLLSRSIVGFIAMTLFFTSLKLLPTGTAVSIRYIAPIFAAIFAFFILKESIKLSQWVFFLGAFIGVVLLKGFDGQINVMGFLYVILSALFTGLVFIIVRKIGSDDHPVVIVNYFMTTSTIIGGVLSINYWIQPRGYEWLLLFSLGVFGYFGQLYMTKALQQAETKLVAPLKYIEVIFTMIAGVIWFAEDYTLWSILGILLIILCLTLNVLVVNKDSKY